MSFSIDRYATAWIDSLRAAERALEDSRAQWSDSARSAFDSRFATPIISDAKRTGAQLQTLASELNSATRLLNDNSN